MIDRIRFVQSLREIAIEIPQQGAITLDNVQISAKKGIDIRFVDNLIFKNNSKITVRSGTLWLKDFDSSWDDQCNAVATSIRNITTTKKEADHHVYDLGGRVVRNNSQTEDIKGLNKGIYVYNNKKYVAK